MCAWHRGGGDAAYARSEARTNEGHGTSTLKATGHAYMLGHHLRVYGCGYIILEVRVLFYTRCRFALVKLEEQQQVELEGTTARYFTERPRSKVSL